MVKSSKAVESEIFKVNERKLLTGNADGKGKNQLPFSFFRDIAADTFRTHCKKITLLSVI